VATLTVYSVTGRVVGRVAQFTGAGGSHTAEWDASGSPSGIYFVRLVAGERVITKKFVLLKR